MIEKFNNIFYLIIYLVHFLGVGVYAFQTIFSTKNFMERFGIDPSGAIMIRMAGAFMLAVFLMSNYVGLVRPDGLENTWGFLNLVFIHIHTRRVYNGSIMRRVKLLILHLGRQIIKHSSLIISSTFMGSQSVCKASSVQEKKSMKRAEKDMSMSFISVT